MRSLPMVILVVNRRFWSKQSSSKDTMGAAIDTVDIMVGVIEGMVIMAGAVDDGVIIDDGVVDIEDVAMVNKLKQTNRQLESI